MYIADIACESDLDLTKFAKYLLDLFPNSYILCLVKNKDFWASDDASVSPAVSSHWKVDIKFSLELLVPEMGRKRYSNAHRHSFSSLPKNIRRDFWGIILREKELLSKVFYKIWLFK